MAAVKMAAMSVIGDTSVGRVMQLQIYAKERTQVMRSFCQPCNQQQEKNQIYAPLLVLPPNQNFRGRWLFIPL